MKYKNLSREELVSKIETFDSLDGLQKKLLESITLLHAEFLKKGIYYGWCDKILETLLNLTNSEFGFICELFYKEDGTPFIKSHGISNIAWNNETRKFYEANVDKGLEFFNFNSIWGQTITSGKSYISNNPDTDPHKGGYPKEHGHPQLKSFVGLPVKDSKSNVVGIMGVANNPKGYDQELIDFLSPFVSTYGMLIEKDRIDIKAKISKEKNLESTKIAKESEQRLKKILDLSPFPIAVVDVNDEEIIYWSKSAIQLFGHDPKTTQEWYELAYPDPDYRQDVIRRWKPFLDKAKDSVEAVNTGEYHIVCKDGSIKICELFAQFIPGNLIVTLSDITIRKKAEEKLKLFNHQLQASEQQLQANEQQLRASNQQLSATEQQLRASNQQLIANEQELLKSNETANRYLNVAAEIILILDVNGNIFLLNESGYKLLGYKNDELVGKNWFENCLPEKNIKEIKNVFKQAICGKLENVAHYESDIQTKSGEIKTILWHNTVLQDDNGKITAVLSSGEDITERKQAEEELQSAYQQLLANEQQLRAANQQLSATEQHLRAANQQLQASEQQLRAANQQLKASEIELQNRNQLLRETGEMARVGGWELNVATNKVTWSEETYKIHEVPIDQEPPLEHALNFFHPDDQPILQEALKNAAEKGIPYDLTLKFITAKGKHLITRTICRPETKDEKIIKLRGTFQDVTDREKAEEERRKSDERFRIAQDMSPDGFTIFKPVRNTQNQIIDFIWVYQNAAVAKINGTDPQKVVGQSFLKLFPGQKGTKFWNAYIKVAETGKSITFEDSYLGESMTEKSWLRIVVVPMEENIAILAQDITKRKIAEENLKTTFNTSPSIIAKANLKTGYFIEASQAVTNILGYSIEEFTSKPFMELIHPDDQQKSTDEKNEQVQGKDVTFFENRYLCKNGSYKWIAWFGTKADKNGIVTAIGSDVTERKQVEEAFFRTQKHYQTLFNNAPISIWEEDFTELYNYLEEKKKSGVDDFRCYFDENPGELLVCSQKIKVKNINRATLKLHGAKSQEELVENFQDIFTEKSLQVFKEELVAISEGKKEFHSDNELKTLSGEIRQVSLSFQFDLSLPNEKRVLLATTDITERIQAEEKLKQSEVLLKEAQHVAHLGHWELDPEVGTPVWSDEIFHIFGLDPAKSEPSFVDHETHILPEDWPILNNAVTNASLNGTSFDINFRIERPDGEIRWMQALGRTMKDENGKVKKLFGTAQDVTAQKQAEEKLQQSEERFEMAINAAQDGIWDWNLITNEVYFSPNWKKMLGFEDLEIPNDFSFWETRTDPDGLKRTREAINEIIQKKKDRFDIEFKMKHKNGLWVDILSRAEAVIDDSGTPTRLVGTHIDITERKQAEEELIIAKEKAEESEKNLRALVNTSPISIFIVDLTGSYLYVNPAWESAMGYTLEESLKLNAFKDVVYQDDFPELSRKLQARLKGESVESTYELNVISKHKQKINAELTISLIDYQNQKAILGMATDITDRKKAEKDLIKAKEKAEESERLKSAFLANMSHEIRTPMNGILGFTDLLKDPQLSGEDQQYFINIIEKSGDRMLNTINDIIDISKLEAGQVDVVISDVNLNEKMDELFEFFLPEAKKKDVQFAITNREPNHQAKIKSDSEKINSILTNFIKNAIKYTPSGSIEFGYSISKKGKQNELEFYIKDTGIGIPKDRQNAIFNRFEQADIKDQQAFEGSGLGLAISKAYIELLGGKFRVESEEGVGSEFYFTIPYHPIKSEVENNLITQNKSTEKVKKLSILIVEDDETSSCYLARILKDKTENIQIVKDGLEAVNICKKNPNFDIVLMDIKLPKIDGLEATKRIRQFNKEVKIIAQTAHALDGDREIAKEAGCDDYITKPFDKNRLFEILSHIK